MAIGHSWIVLCNEMVARTCRNWASNSFPGDKWFLINQQTNEQQIKRIFCNKLSLRRLHFFIDITTDGSSGVFFFLATNKFNAKVDKYQHEQT